MTSRFWEYPLVSALRERRSRRFGLGMKIPAGPLEYSSRFLPQPLSHDEEGALAWAACGITGPALADLCFAPAGGGNIMAGLAGRTVASGDGMQTVSLIVMNDTGAWWMRRPQELSPLEIDELITLGRHGEFGECYRRMRVPILDRRVQPPVEPVFNINANRWSCHARGSSYFLPVAELCQMYLNGLLEILNEETGCFIVDERNGFRPAGLKPFARSCGGHLDDDPRHGRVLTIKQVEQMVTDFVNHEMGMLLQNLGLMTQALGLGGFPHFANHDFGWFEALQFRMQPVPASDYLAMRGLTRWAVRWLGRDVDVPMAIGLERNGKTLLKALTPPYFASMSEAVNEVVNRKFGPAGIFRRGQTNSGWRDDVGVRRAVPEIPQCAIEATIAYAEYVWSRYRRFPAHVPPFRLGLAHQAVHVDPEFYERFYQPDVLSETQRSDFAGLRPAPKSG